MSKQMAVQQRSASYSAGPPALMALAFGMAIVLGTFVALAGPGLFSYLIVGVIASLFLFLLRPDQYLLLMAAAVFLVIGQLLYFAKINQALWIGYGLAGLLFLRLPSIYAKSPLVNARFGLPLGLAFGLFASLLLLSTLVNWPPFMQVVVGSKNLLLMWSVFLAIACFAIPIEKLERAIKWLLPLVLLQLPFVIYQYAFVASGRSNRGGTAGVSWDAIVGTFGGDPNSGGASGTMAFMLVLGALLAINLWRHKRMGVGALTLVLLVAAVSVVLAEVKVVAVLLPIGFVVIAWKTLFRNPVKAFLGITMVLATALGVLLAYDRIHYANTGQQSRDIGDLVDKTFGYSLDTQYINFETGEMGRAAALLLWWKEGFVKDPLRGLLGYGPGSSRSASNFAVGEVAQRYKFGIDRSAATQLLWEVGLAGLLSYVWILLAGAVIAMRSSASAELGERRAMLEFCSAGLVLAVVTLPYSRDLLEVPALGFTAMCLLGYVVQAHTVRRLSQGPVRRHAIQSRR